MSKRVVHKLQPAALMNPPGSPRDGFADKAFVCTLCRAVFVGDFHDNGGEEVLKMIATGYPDRHSREDEIG